jgi:hypothetical protein
VHRLYAADDNRDVLLRLKVDKKGKPKPFVPGDTSNGNMFEVFGVAGLTKNWRSGSDQLRVAYKV